MRESANLRELSSSTGVHTRETTWKEGACSIVTGHAKLQLLKVTVAVSFAGMVMVRFTRS